MMNLERIVNGEIPVIIYGIGDFQRDFLYIFNDVKVNSYIVDDDDNNEISPGGHL